MPVPYRRSVPPPFAGVRGDLLPEIVNLMEFNPPCPPFAKGGNIYGNRLRVRS